LKILLDTHAFLWWLSNDDRLGGRARRLIEDEANTILVSMASLWEIVAKVRVGKLAVDVAEVIDAVALEGFTRLDITFAHLLALVRLRAPHRDPFDHLLIAQAVTEDAFFISDDRNAGAYPVRVVTCREA
jgi:PIN domain nuclease of toxin-antitoxin system